MKKCFINQDFFDINKCTSFVFIKDKEKLLNYIKDFKLPYQKKINIDSKFQYGYEIEFVEAPLLDVNDDIRYSYDDRFLTPYYTWSAVPEDTITESVTRQNPRGGELVAPISYNTDKDWEKLEEICDILKDNNASIDDRCSLHVHIGFDKLDLTIEKMEKFLKLWASYENVIYKFSMGEWDRFRTGIDSFARPFLNAIVDLRDLSDINDVIMSEPEIRRRDKAINFKNLHNKFHNKKVEMATIEFRIANGTTNPKIIQNLIRLYCNLLNSISSKDKLMDYYISEKFESLDKISSDIDDENIEYEDDDNFDNYEETRAILSEYEMTDFESALELVDIVFDNNHDKLCFLKQYLKNDDIEIEKKYIKKSI